MDTNTVLLKKNRDFDEIKDYTKESIVKKEIEQLEFYNLNSKKCTKKLPSLIPLRPRIKTRKGKSLCNYIIPSPWCPSREKVFGDPKAEGSVSIQVIISYCYFLVFSKCMENLKFFSQFQ